MEDEILAVGDHVLERLGCSSVHWLPEAARARAAQLIAAADEAESEPRFSEEDIAAILGCDAADAEREALREQLLELRKKRGES